MCHCKSCYVHPAVPLKIIYSASQDPGWYFSNILGTTTSLQILRARGLNWLSFDMHTGSLFYNQEQVRVKISALQ